MYINETHIGYYAAVAIIGLFVGMFVDWMNKRLPEYKKVFSKEIFTEYFAEFKPNYILMLTTSAIYVGLLYFYGIKDTFIANLDLIKFMILTPMLLSAFVIDYYKNLSEEVVNWAKEMKGQGIKLYILSNTNNEEKVKTVAEKLGIQYKHFAMKPLKRGFKYVQKETNIKPENIAVVGDQIFTDVLGGNRSQMFTILVDPIDDKKDYWYTAWKRPIENKIKNKYKTKEEKNKNVY